MSSLVAHSDLITASLCKRFDTLQQKQNTFVTSEEVGTLLANALADLKTNMNSCEDLNQQLVHLGSENAKLRQGSESQAHTATQLKAKQDELQAALDGMKAKLTLAERDLHHAEAQVAAAQPLKDKVQASDTELASLRTARELLQLRVDEHKAQEATYAGEIKSLQDGHYEWKLKFQHQQDEAKAQQEAFARQNDEVCSSKAPKLPSDEVLTRAGSGRQGSLH